MRTAALASAAALLASTALAQSEPAYIPMEQAPASVMTQTDCDDAGPGGEVMINEAFGAVVFRVRCAGNNANYVQALIFADDRAGRNARLIRFPDGDPGAPATEISNVRLFPAARAIGSIDVDTEDGLAINGVCRSERLWRLAGERPTLVWWRTNGDCEGAGRWRVRLDRRTRAERRLAWS